MARVNNLTNFLNDVATAIKQKLGDNTPIPASQFDTKIGEIETGGNYQTKSISITTNGNYTQLPDTGFDAMDQVVISVNVPGPDLSDATAQAKDILLGKTAYTSDGKLTGTFKGAKYFGSIQEMNNDQTMTLGDYALIYRASTEPIVNDDVASRIEFPEQVVFDTAITESNNGQLMIDNQEQGIWTMSFGSYTPTSAEIQIDGNDFMILVQYTSEDGITYTRTSTTEFYDFGVQMTFSDYENLLPVIGHFMQKAAYYQGGFYHCENIQDKTRVRLPLLSGFSYDISGQTISNAEFDMTSWDGAYSIQKLKDLQDEIITNESLPTTPSIGWITKLSNNKLALLYCIGGQYNNAYDVTVGISTDGNTTYIHSGSASSSYDTTLYVFTIDDLDTLTYTKSTIVSRDGYHQLNFIAYPVGIYRTGGYTGDVWRRNVSLYLYNTNNYSEAQELSDACIYAYIGYTSAPNQYTLTNSNQVLPGISAYGKTGIITGDTTIYDNLDSLEIIPRVFGLSKSVFTNYQVPSEGLVDSYYFRYNTDVSLTPYRMYHITDTNWYDVANLLLKSVHALPVLATTNEKSYSISYNAYDKVYIYVAYSEYSYGGEYNCPVHTAVYQEDGTCIFEKKTSQTYGSFDGYNHFWWNGHVYFIENKKLYRMDNNVLTQVCTINAGSPKFALDSVQGHLYVFDYYQSSTGVYVYDVNLSSGSVSNISGGKLVGGNENFVWYMTSNKIYYKKQADTSFKNVTITAPSNYYQYTGCANDGNTLFVISGQDGGSNGSVWKIDYDNNTCTLLTSGYTGSSYNALYTAYNGLLYSYTRYGYIHRLNNDGTTTQLYNSNMLEGNKVRFEILDNTSFIVASGANNYQANMQTTELTYIAKNLVDGFVLNGVNCITCNNKLFLVSGDLVSSNEEVVTNE